MNPLTNNNRTVPNKNLDHTPKPTLPDQPEEKGTLEQLGGISCALCDGTFHHKKQFHKHFETRHEGASLLYKCIQCSKTFAKYKTFHDHCYRHVSGKRFRCEKCRKQFSQSAYKLHMEIIHAEVKHEADQRYPCTLCSRHFDTFTLLAQHIRFCNRDQPFTCTVCNKSFSEKSFLLRHLPFHSEIRNFKCKLCERSFKTKRCLTLHSLLHAGNRKLKYECKHCQKTFLTSTKLTLHMNTHSKDRPYRCDHCDMTFTNNPNRIKHLRQHIRSKPILCGHRNWVLLGKFIRSNPSEERIDSDNEIANDDIKPEQKDHIKVHGTLHTGDGLEQFCCEYCGEKFPYRRSWLRHTNRRHIQYKYQCNTCNETIVCANPISFLCDYCGKGFSDKSSLIRHILNMHMQCKYNCDICKKAFLSFRDLESHLPKHAPTKQEVIRIASMVPVTAPKKNHVVKDFSCQYCQKDFTYLRSCMRHMKREHNHKIEKKPRVTRWSEGDSSAISEEIEIKSTKEVNSKPEQNIEDNSNVNQNENDPSAVSAEIDIKNPDQNAEGTQDTGAKFAETKSQNLMLYMPYILPVAVPQPYYIVLEDKMGTKEEQTPEVSRDPTQVNITNISPVICNKTSVEHLKHSEKLDEDLINFLGTILDSNNSPNSSDIAGELNSSEFGSNFTFNSDSFDNDPISLKYKEKYNLFPCVQSESTNTTQDLHPTEACATGSLKQYSSEFDISTEEYSKLWNKEPEQELSDIFGLNDDIVLPHIDPLLTIKDSNYEKQLNKKIFPDPFENDSTVNNKDVDELISVDKLHSLLNDVPNEFINVSEAHASELTSERSNATQGFDEYINNILPTLCSDAVKFENEHDSKRKIKEENYSYVNNRGKKNYNSNILPLYDKGEEANECEAKAAVIADIKSYYILIDGCQSYKPQSSTRINAAAR